MGRRKIIADDQLLMIAREEFLRNGAFGSTREISRQAGISEAALFKRYPTKAALFLAAMAPEHVDIGSIIQSFSSETSPRLVLTEIGHRILAYYRRVIPVVMHLITHPSISMSDVNAHFKGKPVVELTEALAAHFAEADSRGTVRVSDPLAAAALFISAIHSLAVFELMEVHGGEKMDNLIKPFVEVLWRGIKPDGRSKKTKAPENKASRREAAKK